MTGTMLEQMNHFIIAEGLLSETDKVLLAVSGGVDSVVMAELFRQRGQDCVIAHCNFGLRGEESDEDERFTHALANRIGFPFMTRRFDTTSYAGENGLSIQMAARELRYSWFQDAAAAARCTRIALAHHLDDQAETFLLNLGRGSGLRGLSGMPARRAQVIRPLLFAERSEIIGYALDQGLEWRDDTSNESSSYLRNRLRHEALPLLNDIIPGFTGNLLNSLEILKGAGLASGTYARELHARYVSEDADTIMIELPGEGFGTALRGYLAHEWLQPYGFNPDQVRQALAAFTKGPGRTIHADKYTLETSRTGFFILPRSEAPLDRYWAIQEAGTLELPDAGLSISCEESSPGKLGPHDPAKAILDVGKLQFPLLVRFRRPGDSYRPLGMRGKKKLSDLFIDAKIPVHRKDSIPIILSGDAICWVAGFRIAEEFKVTSGTERVLIIEYHPENTR